jgi:hypothetical protein
MSAGLLCGLGGNKCAGLNDAQRLGMVSALELERLVVGTVDADDLVRVHADPNASRRGAALVGAALHNDVEGAMSAVRLVESEHPLAADRSENDVIRSHGAQTQGRLRACTAFFLA